MGSPRSRCGIELEKTRNVFLNVIRQQYPAIKYRTQSDDILAQIINQKILIRKPNISMTKPIRTSREKAEFTFRL